MFVAKVRAFWFFLRRGRSLDRRDVAASLVNRITINGFGGNDQLVNRTGVPSTINGHDGDDVIVGGTRADVIRGGNGNDRIFGDVEDTGIVNPGDGGNDFILGGNGDDQILGKGGDDAIRGEAGNDIILGGADNDLIVGGDGNDFISGDDGNDRLFGQLGNDILRGGFGNDLLQGSGGNDNLDGGGGNDTVIGNGGNDLLITRFASGSNNTLVGGTGNDRYRFIGNGTSFGTDQIQERGGEGFDRIEIGQLAGTPAINLNGPTVLTLGVRTVTASPTGNLEATTDSSEVPQLRVNRIGPNSLSISATDANGIRSNSSGIIRRVTALVRVQTASAVGGSTGFRTVRVVLDNIRPTRRDAAGNFFYDLDFESRIGMRVVGLTSATIEFGANVFIDNQGHGNLAQTLRVNT